MSVGEVQRAAVCVEAARWGREMGPGYVGAQRQLARAARICVSSGGKLGVSSLSVKAFEIGRGVFKCTEGKGCQMCAGAPLQEEENPWGWRMRLREHVAVVLFVARLRFDGACGALCTRDVCVGWGRCAAARCVHRGGGAAEDSGEG